MFFTLVYRGRLPAVSGRDNRVPDKQRIRRELHPQLAELWRINPALAGMRSIDKGQIVNGRLEATPRDTPHSFLELGGFKLVPLVQRKIQLTCSLEIIFLRRGALGDLVTHGGDLDNRLKTLFDALRMPHEISELAKDKPPQEPDGTVGLFYCLLEDDALITRLTVETAQLLRPVQPPENETDVDLLIRVALAPVEPSLRGLAYL